jgi:hypothetical protein
MIIPTADMVSAALMIAALGLGLAVWLVAMEMRKR